ncbi:ankyrin repeat protein [Cooperia oncophora]
MVYCGFQKLLARKADVHATNEHGMTPLHYACYWGFEQIAEDLIISGAQIGACNKRGQTPMDVCQGPSRQAIADDCHGKWPKSERADTLQGSDVERHKISNQRCDSASRIPSKTSTS